MNNTPKSLRFKLVGAMILAALSIGLVLYFLTHQWKIACAVSGVLLLTDLHLAPKVFPHIFKSKSKK